MTFEGTVEARNERGIKVRGEWCNVSKFNVIHELPEVGDQVLVDVDTKGFLKGWNLLEDEPAAQASSSCDERITRLTVLKAAAHFAADRADIKSADVLRIADCWLKWVEGS
jgi:hypothetical protein